MILTMPENIALPVVYDFFTDLGFTERLVERIICAIKELNYKDCIDRSGCYIAFYDRATGRLFAKYFGLVVNEEKQLKYLQCATEKVTRMARYHLATSFDKLDEENERYGGGVSFNDTLFIACSGFPPEIDEAVSYLVGLHGIKWFSEQKGVIPFDVLKETNNNFTLEILSRYPRKHS